MLSALHRTGLLSPAQLVALARALRTWDKTVAALLATHAGRHPDRLLLVDEEGGLTYGEVDARTNALARELRRRGVAEGDAVGLMCRNHRGFVESLLAVSKLGADVLLLNTDFAGPQLAAVLERERPVLVLADPEFGIGVDPRSLPGADTAPLTPPGRAGRMTILSSGTTGAPKGVRRAGSTPLGPLLALLERIPLRAGDTHVIPAPFFHGWGLLHLALSLILGNTVVTRSRFDAEATVALIAAHRAQSAPMVPVMLLRIMELDTLDRYDLSSLRSIPLSGSAIPAGLAVRAMDRLGDVIYNLYGSTEVALATIATPADLRAAPGTAGRTVRGTPVRILGADDRPVPAGETGVVFVRSTLASEGYSGGGGKRAVDGMLSSGDLGHFDAEGRLFIDGREDEMIVSGGENVYPGEVEDVLVAHPAVAEAAVVGVPDDAFGQRLEAFVVRHGEVDADELRDHVRAQLARYKVPRAVSFVDALPRNPSGKVLKRELYATA